MIACIWCIKARGIFSNVCSLDYDKINQKNRMLFDLRCRSVVGLKSTKPETTASTPASQTVKNQELTKMLEPIREDIKKWIDCYESCLKKATETGDRSTERNTSYCLGRVYGIPGDFEKAIPYFERSLKLTKEVEDKSIEGLLYESLGLAYYGLGDFRKAIYYLERCLQFANDMKNKSAEGVENSKLENPYLGFGDVKTATKCYNIYLEHFANRKYWCIERSVYRFLGDAYGKLGYFKKAINCHEHYLKIDKEVEHKKEELSVCENLGSAYESLGDFKKALFYYELCLEIARHVKNRSAEEEAYSNLARTYFSLGDIKKAVDYDENALKIAIEMGDKDGEGRAYGNLGTSYHSLGEFKKAIECHERCLKIARDSKNRLVEGRVYGYLGAAFFRLGNFKIAIEYYEHRLEIAKEVGDRKGEGYGYGNLGNTYAVLGNFKKAIDCYERRLKIAIEIRDRLGEGHAYLHLGNCYKALGDVSKAKEHYELQLEIANETGEKGPDGKAYCALGQCYFKIREVQKSIHYMELGLKIAKQMDDMSAVGEAYELLGSIHESVGSLHEALQCFQVSVEAFEKVRIRLQSEDEWKISLRDVHQDAYTALVRVLLKLDRSVEALCAAEKGRAQALKELMESYFGIRRTETMSSAEEKTIQGIIREIPFNTIFLAFDQGVLNLWVIQNGKDVQRRVNEVGDLNTRDHYASFLQELVESTFESIGVRAAINCEDRSLGELRKPSLTKKISHETQSHSSQSRQHQLRRLYDVIMDPIADLIHGDEIIIVPEGPLWLVPYAALMDPNSRFLSDSFRVRVIPSLTSFKLISDCPADYHSKSGALVVGDPWVQEVVIDEGQKLDQLPDARREVEEIGRILNTETLTGKDATKNEVLKRLSTVALVHIAAHGRMETGEIALCPNPSRASRVPKDKDFLLTMNDVMNVKLTARLVVLSCCHSGRGEIKAEGVVGIARAFLGAGARSVLVSLWAIDDEATLEFMKSFYQHLVEGKSAGEALNQAMKCMRESENFSEVKYWAPFVLIGDDVTLEFPESD